MKQINRLGLNTINELKIYRLFAHLLFFAFIVSAGPLAAQKPQEAIQQLKEGYLIVRFPAYKNKIDTLESMIAKAKDDATKKRLTHLLNQAIYDRDTVRMDYIDAFKNHYDFSNVIYFFDYESHNLATAHYYVLGGKGTSIKGIADYPKFYLHFERTEDSKIDALVFYDQKLRRIPPPFPNNFSSGGLSYLFMQLSNKSAPAKRIQKINRRLHKYYNSVKS